MGTYNPDDYKWYVYKFTWYSSIHQRDNCTYAYWIKSICDKNNFLPADGAIDFKNKLEREGGKDNICIEYLGLLDAGFEGDSNCNGRIEQGSY